MKKAKEVIALIFLVGLCLSAAFAVCSLAMRFGILFSVFAGVSGLFLLLGALIRAPEGCENADGFHVRGRRKQAAHARHGLAVSHSHS
jgi:hypothetical protein